MELFYKGIQERKKSNMIQSTDFDHVEAIVEKLIDQVFRKQYGLEGDRKMILEGQHIVVKEVIQNFAEKIIEQDKLYAPFSIEGLERSELLYYVPISNAPGQAVMSGKIDRLDRKGDVIRVLDYKTGKNDEHKFDSIESLFNRTDKRNKAAFQTMIYTLLYNENHDTSGLKLAPGLINRKTLYDGQNNELILDDRRVEDARDLLPEFKDRLKTLLEELYDPAQTFKQTQNTENCRYCNFKNICYR